jgi:cell division protein ZapA
MTVDRTERSSMATVNVTINAKQYRMACEDGQEQHLLRLAEDLDRRITKLHESFGEVGDTRLTVMAALTLADELAESAKRIRRLEEELAGLQDARVVSADRAQATQAAIASAFNSAAERIENLAKSLNQGLGDGGVAMG